MSIEEDFWEPILNGEKDPVHIIYVRIDEEVDLSDIEEFGMMAGMWSISEVASCSEGIELHKDDAADVFVVLNGWEDEAIELSNKLPQVPIVLANAGGFDQFDFRGFPPQVVGASWAAPRPGDFMDVIGDALGKVATRIIYEANKSDLIIPIGLYDELLERLSKFPEERFLLNPRVFEETIAELLRKMGYEAIVTPRSGDQGRDVIASYQTPTGSMLMLVECKRFAKGRLVGPEPVARIWTRLFEDRANMAMVITTSGFQKVTKREAESKGYQLSLKDGDQFIEWVRKYSRKT